MNPDERFTRAVAALPGPVRERLDSDAPLDWTALEDARTGAELGEAARAHRFMKETKTVETYAIEARAAGDRGALNEAWAARFPGRPLKAVDCTRSP